MKDGDKVGTCTCGGDIVMGTDLTDLGGMPVLVCDSCGQEYTV